MTRSPTASPASPACKYAIPLIDGQVLAIGQVGPGTGALVRGIRGDDLGKLGLVANNIKQARSAASTPAKAWRSARAWPRISASSLGDMITLISPDGDVTPIGTTPRVKAYPVVAIFEIGMSEYRRFDHLHAAFARRSSISTWTAGRRRSRSTSTIPTMSMR